jgi:two-component system sensor histidine kinase/response regulator
VLGSFRRHKQGQEIEPYEYKLVTKSGRVMDVLLTTRLIPYEEGQAILGVITDVSQRRQAEESLRQYALEILARNEELDAFAHTVAHDVRNPLGLVIGFAEVLALEEAEKGNQELAVHLENIARNARQVDNIVEELLLLSGLRGEEVELQELDMADLVNEALGRLEIMIQNMRAEVTLPDSWPAALGHPPWVVQVWVNYLSNALKYGGRPPHVELGAELHDGVASFWIQDDGPGLTEQQQAQLFVPFTRLAKLRAQGYGLGLSIVRRIVERLGGQVAVESEGVPGLGSRFYFTLQAAPDDEETQSTASNPPEIPV